MTAASFVELQTIGTIVMLGRGVGVGVCVRVRVGVGVGESVGVGSGENVDSSEISVVGEGKLSGGFVGEGTTFCTISLSGSLI